MQMVNNNLNMDKLDQQILSMNFTNTEYSLVKVWNY